MATTIFHIAVRDLRYAAEIGTILEQAGASVFSIVGTDVRYGPDIKGFIFAKINELSDVDKINKILAEKTTAKIIL